ncbi:MAG: hypothetical protein AB7S38_16735 [Vulcanimicrobiota bacterium]
MVNSTSALGIPIVPRNRDRAPLASQETSIQPTYDELALENAHLRGELKKAQAEAGPIRLDPAAGKLVIKGLSTPDYSVDRLKVKTEGLGDQLALDAFLADGRPALPPLEKYKDMAVEVEDLKARIPEATINRTATSAGAEALAKNGIQDLDIRVGEGGRLTVSGKVDKLIDIPFELTGKLSVGDGGSLRFELEKSHIFGVVPVPKLVLGLAASMTGSKLEKVGVRQQDNAFEFDLDGLLPPNIQMGLTNIDSRKGELIIEGGSKPTREAPRPASNPTVITEMGPWGIYHRREE